jgi:type I restriction enzyme, S subunit
VRSPVTIDQHAGGHPAGWTWVPLTDVAELATGHTPDRTRPDYWNGGIPWISLTEIRKLDGRCASATDLQVSSAGIRNSSAVVLPPGTVCFSRTASVGFVTIMGVPMATSQDFVNWICGDQLDPRYLMHALRCSRTELRALSTGSTHKTIYLRVAEMFRILMPPLEDQLRIVDILDKAEALRVKRRAAIAQLNTLGQSIFIDMFGEPTDNPMGWPIKTIGDILSSANYGTSGKAATRGALPILRMGNITSTGEIDVADLKFIDLVAKDIERYTVRRGDILFNRTNSADLVGKAAVVTFDTPMAYAGYLIRLRCGPLVEPEYLGSFLNLSSTKRVLRSMCRTIIGMANINAREARGIRLPVPPHKWQVEFANRIGATRLALQRLRDQLSELDALFASLQNRAFRGEL